MKIVHATPALMVLDFHTGVTGRSSSPPKLAASPPDVERPVMSAQLAGPRSTPSTPLSPARPSSRRSFLGVAGALGIGGLSACATAGAPGGAADADDAAAPSSPDNPFGVTDGELGVFVFDGGNGVPHLDVTEDQIGRASVGKECRSRWSPYH